MKKIYTALLFLGLIGGFVACEKEKDFALTTLSVSDEMLTPSYVSAIARCVLKSDATISEAYVQYAVNSDFADCKKAKMTEVNGLYNAQLTDLQDNTVYYVRYEASNCYSSVISECMSKIQTLEITLPIVTTTSASDISNATATIGGNVTDNGGAEVTERGVCYSTTENPTIENTKVISGKGTGEFSINLDNLTDNTTYYVCAYAINSKGTAYGEQVSFTTKTVILPTVTTTAVTQVTETTAITGGNVTADGNATVTESGVVYGTSQNPTTSNSKVTAGSGTGSYTCNLTGLQDGTNYYVRAYAINSKGTAYGEEVTFTTEKKAEPEYVDLGLSVKWATFNVGASRPEEYGDYFAWGETRPKTTYDWSTYKYCNGSKNTLTKYCTDNYYGTVDNNTTLDLSDDAAHANWGGSWRMPTHEEQEELHTQCTWTWTTQNGVYGYKVTSKKSGYTNKSIFLPAAGYRSGSLLRYAGSDGYYWSSSLSTYSPDYAFVLDFSSYYVGRRSGNRYYGFSVRPVCQ